MASDPLAWLVSAEGVPSAYAAARDGIDVMLRDRGLRRTSPELTAESLARGAHASAVLEGSSSSLEEVLDGRGDAIAVDSLRVSAMLLSVVPVIGRSPLQALARVHAVAAATALPEDEVGRPRGPEAAARLQVVAQMLTSAKDAPALLVAAVAHAELMAAAPFPSHNGLVARAVERLVLVARGVDEKSLVVPEAGHLALRAEYESNLRGYAEGGRNGVHSWALYGAEAYAAGAEASPLKG